MVIPPTQRSFDEAAILSVLSRWEEAWSNGDASMAAEDYADNADWLNPWGDRLAGRASIERFLEAMFSDPQFGYRKTEVTSRTVRFIKPDVAVALTTFEVVGQRATSGHEVPRRYGHSCRVLSKREGRWSILTHFFMDENQSLRSQ